MKLPFGRISLLVVALTLAGAAASALGVPGGSNEDRRVALRDIGGLLHESPGGVVVDDKGRPVLGPDGKPLRIAPDGRRIIDSRGRIVRDRKGRPLTVKHARRGNGRKARRAGGERARGGTIRGGRRPERRRGPRRPVRPPRRPGGSPATPAPVVVGVTYQDADRHNAAMRPYDPDVNAADPRPQIEVVVDHINRTGGISGRPVELRPYPHDYSDGRPIDQTVAEICAFFREGKRPVAVVNQGPRAYALAPCLEAAGIPLITHWPSTLPSGFPGAGSLYSPSGLALDRFAQPYVGALRRDGFIRPSNKVGLAWHGARGFDEAAAAVKQELERARIPVVAEYRAAELGSRADMPRLLAETGNAVLQFRRRGVDRVLTVDNFGGTVGAIGLACHAQGGCGWRYGLSTLNAPAKTAAGAADLGSRQLEGAVAVGWSPLLDIGDDPSPPPTLRTCREIMSSRGVDLGDSTAFGQYSAFGYCDDLLALRAALEGRDPSPTAVRAGFAELTGFQSALTLGTALGNGRRDGAGRFRLLRWHSGCDCFRYEGGIFDG